MVAAVAFTGATALWEHQSVQKTGGTRYENGVGELTKVALADGSVVTMNTQTELRVRYSSGRRDIDLVRGEALFTVAHDSRRPFAVHVGDWSAVAVGTEFSIRRLGEPTADVIVTEGIVRLLPQDGNVTAAPQITANQKALIRAAGQVQIDSLSGSQIAQQLAWRTHLVIFDGKPLREALTEMNRYARKPIVVEDPALAERRIAGVFPTTDIKTFVSAMTATLGVEAVAKDNVVLLRSLN
jgi:transmembrane sensor